MRCGIWRQRLDLWVQLSLLDLGDCCLCPANSWLGCYCHSFVRPVLKRLVCIINLFFAQKELTSVRRDALFGAKGLIFGNCCLCSSNPCLVSLPRGFGFPFFSSGVEATRYLEMSFWYHKGVMKLQLNRL